MSLCLGLCTVRCVAGFYGTASHQCRMYLTSSVLNLYRAWRYVTPCLAVGPLKWMGDRTG